MKTWIRRSLIATTGLLVALGGLAACSHGPRHGFGMSEGDSAQWRERAVERVSGRLDLDAAQKAKLQALADAMAEQRRALAGADGRAPRAEFQALIAGTQFDRSKAQTLLNEKTAAVQAQGPKVIAAAADFYDGLKPEQQQQVRDFLARGRR